MQAKIFKRYVWLVTTISGAGEISIDELDSRWSRSSVNETGESVYPRRSFLRHKEDISEIFGIEIGYSRARNTYFISNTDDVRSDELRRWILDNFAVNNAISESQSLRERILLEEIPEGTQFLPTIVAAMRENHQLSVVHQRFGQEPHPFLLEPYCLKVFKQRWYVYGQPSDCPGERRIYALDRMIEVLETDQSFVLPERFDAETEFRDYYGVFTNGSAEIVRIRVLAKGAYFLRSLPLHPSQKEVVRNDNWSEFEFFVAPTFDFEQQLKTYGTQMIIMQPQWLHDKFQHDAEQMLNQYRSGDFA